MTPRPHARAFSPELLFPRDTLTLRSRRWTWVVLAAVNLEGTIRSGIHMFSPDSGAESIAGMDVHVTGGANIIALLAQWGGGQMIEALIAWAVIVRYRALTPLLLLAMTLEQVFRSLIGHLKPLTTTHTPPGALSQSILLPLLTLTFLASLWATRNHAPSAPATGRATSAEPAQ